MGYSTTIRLKGKLADQFMPCRRGGSPFDKEMLKTVFLSLCMRESNFENTNQWTLIQLYKELYNSLKDYASYIEEEWKVRTKQSLDDNDNCIDFHGWEYSDSRSMENPWESTDDIVSFYIDNIFKYVTIRHDSPFGEVAGSRAKSENFYNKYDQINEELNDIELSINSMLDHQFIDYYRDSEFADEDDGDSRRFLEEVEELEKEEE